MSRSSVAARRSAAASRSRARNDLAVSLASGKLPVKLNVIEERTVGPDLGKDSIHKGVIASLVGTLGVIIFMLVTYGRFGVYANIALVVNAFLILGDHGVVQRHADACPASPASF